MNLISVFSILSRPCCSCGSPPLTCSYLVNCERMRFVFSYSKYEFTVGIYKLAYLVPCLHMFVDGGAVLVIIELLCRSWIPDQRIKKREIERERWEKMSEVQKFQLGTVGALSLSVVSSVSIVICNKALISTLGFTFGEWNSIRSIIRNLALCYLYIIWCGIDSCHGIDSVLC